MATTDFYNLNSDEKAYWFQAYLMALAFFVILYFFVLMAQGRKRREVFSADFMAQFN